MLYTSYMRENKELKMKNYSNLCELYFALSSKAYFMELRGDDLNEVNLELSNLSYFLREQIIEKRGGRNEQTVVDGRKEVSDGGNSEERGYRNKKV